MLSAPETGQMCVFTSKRLLLLPKLLDNHKFSHDPRSLRLCAPPTSIQTQKWFRWGHSVVLWLLAVTHWLVISYLTRHTLTNRCFLLSCYWTTRSTTQTNDAQLKMKNDKVNFKEKNQCCDQENVITLMLQSLFTPRDASITHFHYHFRQFKTKGCHPPPTTMSSLVSTSSVFWSSLCNKNTRTKKGDWQ